MSAIAMTHRYVGTRINGFYFRHHHSEDTLGLSSLATLEAFLEPDETISAGLWGVYNHLDLGYAHAQPYTLYAKYICRCFRDIRFRLC